MTGFIGHIKNSSINHLCAEAVKIIAGRSTNSSAISITKTGRILVSSVSRARSYELVGVYKKASDTDELTKFIQEDLNFERERRLQ